MQLVIGIVVGLAILIFLVVAHELGHAIAAIQSGVTVEEFGVGFPPMAWSKKLKNGVVFSLNWLPLGGFVKLKGEYDEASSKGDYGNASFWQKTKILFAGVIINWLVAVVLLSILAVIGLPKVLDNQFSVAADTNTTKGLVQVVDINKSYPADKAGIKPGDQIKEFAGQKVDGTKQLVTLIQQHKGQKVEVVYVRQGVTHAVTVALRSSGSAYFGAGLGQNEFIHATWSAPIVGIATTGQFTYLTFQSLGSTLYNSISGLISQLNTDQSVRQNGANQLSEAGQNVTGPIGIIGVIFPSAEQAGPVQLLFLTAIISLSLAVMNVLPIPALDGGRWFTMLIFKLRRKKLTREREERIQNIGFSVLMVLVVVVTIVDVTRFF